MADETSIDDSKNLLDLCRTGRLYDIEKWIADGRSIEIHTRQNAKKQTLLQVAVQTGFHSLVELIAKHDPSPSSKNAALEDAVGMHRLDLMELLVENGADIKSVALADVLLSWEPKVFHFFLERGADPVTGAPFAVAFGEKVRTALRPFVELKKARPEIATAMQEQVDCALRHFCYEGNLKWVSLLMWAGGDPRSSGPSLGKEYTSDPECYTSGVIEACYSGNVEVMKKLKLDKARDDLSNLLHCAAVSGQPDALRYLLEIGANPNGKENGGSSALDTALWHLNTFQPYRTTALRSKYAVSKALDCASELLAHGAVWNPAPGDLSSLRRTLLECEPGVTIEVLQLFRKHNACPAEHVHKLLATPKIKEHLAHQGWHLSRLGISLDKKGTKRRSASS